MRALIAAALVGFGLAIAPGSLLAAQLKEHSVKDEGKKARVTFVFSAEVKAKVISHYANNFVGLNIAGLTFSRTQIASEPKPKDKALEAVYRYFKCVAGKTKDDPGEIRIYLSKPVTPADVLVIQNGSTIEIEVLKPRAAGSGDSSPSDETAEWPATSDPGKRADPQPEVDLAPPLEAGSNDSVEPGNGQDGVDPEGIESGATEAVPSPESTTADSVADEPTAAEPEETAGTMTDMSGSEYGSTPLGKLPGTSDGSPRVETAGDSTEINPESRSYQSFDLAQVSVNGVEIKSAPFNEALMELVAGTGFNVVIGEGVSAETVTLNFTRKKMSLLSALDLLSIAYNLVYSVEADAIVIKGK